MVELLLYVAMTGVLLSITAMLLLALLDARAKHQAISEVHDTGMLILERLTQDIRSAEAITMPAEGTSAGSLTLDMYSVSSDPTIFSVASGAFQVKEGGADALPLSNAARVTASGLAVTNLSRSGTPGAVRVQFTLTSVNPSGRNPYSFTQTFYGSASLRQP